uniref:Uncharacterized protein n=1 Tax=viral metagenome TaxID=1070528 RepID=A0A6M3KCW2_9ZZZZ
MAKLTFKEVLAKVQEVNPDMPFKEVQVMASKIYQEGKEREKKAESKPVIPVAEPVVEPIKIMPDTNPEKHYTFDVSKVTENLRQAGSRMELYKLCQMEFQNSTFAIIEDRVERGKGYYHVDVTGQRVPMNSNDYFVYARW